MKYLNNSFLNLEKPYLSYILLSLIYWLTVVKLWFTQLSFLTHDFFLFTALICLNTIIFNILSYLSKHKINKLLVFVFFSLYFLSTIYKELQSFLESNLAHIQEINKSINFIRIRYIMPTAIGLLAIALKYTSVKTLNRFLGILTLIYTTNVLIINKPFYESEETIINKIKNHNTIQDTLPENAPNIYFIIFDRYPSWANLEESFGFKSEELKHFFKIRQLFLAEKSNTLHKTTDKSMSDIFNLQKIDNNHAPYTWIKNSVLVQYLIKQNYTIYNLSFWPLGKYSNYYDLTWYFNPYKTSFPAFDFVASYLWPENLINSIIHYKKERFHDVKKLNNAFDEIIKKQEKKTFSYIHYILPHPNFLYDENGNLKEKDENYQKLPDSIKAFKQTLYANKIAMRHVDSILKYDNNAIIIIQGDHGDPTLMGGKYAYNSINAIYFPKQNYENLHDSINNVNTFRVMLNEYFGQNLDPVDQK